MEGIRSDLYRSMSLKKVEPSEVLILSGKILPVYLLLTVRAIPSIAGSLLDNARLTLEEYFNFNSSLWGFGKEFRISPLLSRIQNIPGVNSAIFDYATQYVINNTDSTLANYTTASVDEDIISIPDDTVVGLLPYKETISGVNSVLSVDSDKVYYLDVGSDIGPQNNISSITLSASSGSDFGNLPFCGLLKIKGEIFGYKQRIGATLLNVTRNVYQTGSANSPVSYLAVERNPIYIVPNILISIIGENS
jgi:hypothetical protein